MNLLKPLLLILLFNLTSCLTKENKNSEIGMLVRENNVGYVAEPGNIENIIKGLCWFINLSINDIKALKINSRELALKSYSKEKVLSQYSQLI